MFDTIFNIVSSSLSWAISVLSVLFSSIGDIMPYFIAMFSLYIIVRFLFVPILGGELGSDNVKNNSKNKKADNSDE